MRKRNPTPASAAKRKSGIGASNLSKTICLRRNIKGLHILQKNNFFIFQVDFSESQKGSIVVKILPVRNSRTGNTNAAGLACCLAAKFCIFAARLSNAQAGRGRVSCAPKFHRFNCPSAGFFRENTKTYQFYRNMGK